LKTNLVFLRQNSLLKANPFYKDKGKSFLFMKQCRFLWLSHINRRINIKGPLCQEDGPFYNVIDDLPCF